MSSNGYHEIGMDHFAIETDSLFKASKEEKLHRNFMGYSHSKTQMMIGLGVSSISDTWYGFAQNVKDLDDYYQLLEWEKIPVFKGHILSQEDLKIRKHILNLMCQFETCWNNAENYIPEILEQLQEMENDGLVKIHGNNLKVTQSGKPFLRNICMAFDLRLKRKAPKTQLFSMTV